MKVINHHMENPLYLISYALIVCGILLISSNISYGEEEKEKDYPNGITANTIKSEELKAFARAYINVQAALDERIEESGEKTYKRTTAILKHEGLTVKRYTQLAQLMNENADFKKAVEEVIQTIKKEEEEQKQ